MTRRAVAWLAVPALVALASTATAKSPVVRVKATPTVVPVGEVVELEVKVLVPTWFSGAPEYPSFELANTITRLPADSSYPTSERVGSETWSGIVRNYRIYPLLGATYTSPKLPLTVRYAHPETRKPVAVTVDVPAFTFRAEVPAGAQDLDPYLAGRSLTLSREIEGEADDLEPGDALVVKYEVSLAGMPSIFLPPLAGELDVPGVSVYADEPDFEDGRVAKRSERVTLVFESGGQYTIPGVELSWWNSRSKTVETASEPPITVSVAGPIPGLPAAVPEQFSRRSALPWVAVLLLLAVAVARWLPRYRRHRAQVREQYRRSEPYAFDQLRKALDSGEPNGAHRAWLRWIDRLDVGIGARRFAEEYGDEDLQSEVARLSRALYAGSDDAFDARRMASAVAQARRRYLRRGGDAAAMTLPPMNP